MLHKSQEKPKPHGPQIRMQSRSSQGGGKQKLCILSPFLRPKGFAKTLGSQNRRESNKLDMQIQLQPARSQYIDGKHEDDAITSSQYMDDKYETMR